MLPPSLPGLLRVQETGGRRDSGSWGHKAAPWPVSHAGRPLLWVSLLSLCQAVSPGEEGELTWPLLVGGRVGGSRPLVGGTGSALLVFPSAVRSGVGECMTASPSSILGVVRCACS